jgi:hypothetical protein
VEDGGTGHGSIQDVIAAAESSRREQVDNQWHSPDRCGAWVGGW